MNVKQRNIAVVLQALLAINNFDELFEDHTIRYGFLNYVAKYSLAKDKYWITEKALQHIKNNNFLKNGSLRRGLKSKKNGFTFEHPIPSNIISRELLENREDKNKILEILNWSDHIVVITPEEDLALRNAGLETKMPDGWKFFADSQFERYKKVGLLTQPLIELDVYGQVKR